ncbi:Gfo/Idh/MocA family protein [Humidisolicoccus flavus]|uniref:Gfo/Idh/MocA family protein n=1 Tax=Humidisolicoccus flavus TaxID=3111414 RepID=UPI00324594A7
MSAPSVIRTAVLGFGVSGRIFHAPFIAANSEFRLDFITTSNAERIAIAAERYPGARILEASNDVFDHADALDLVVIGTPPATHFELAKQAIAAGLHVVVDKPFVPSSAQAKELIDRAEQAGVTLTVFQNRRWDADFLTLRSVIESGRLGVIRTFESRFEWWKPQGFRDWKATATLAEGGGILYDLGSHLIDQALQLFGPVETLTAELRRPADSSSDADNDAFLALRHSSGTISHLHMSGLAALRAPRFHVLGTKAAYTKWGLDTQEPRLIAGAQPSDADFGVEPREHWGVLGVNDDTELVEPERGDYGTFYRRLADTLLRKAPLAVDPRQSLEVLNLIERAHSSSSL